MNTARGSQTLLDKIIQYLRRVYILKKKPCITAGLFLIKYRQLLFVTNHRFPAHHCQQHKEPDYICEGYEPAISDPPAY